MNFHISEYIYKSTKLQPAKQYDKEELKDLANKYIAKAPCCQPWLRKNEDLISNVMVAIWRADETHNDKLGNSLETHRIQHVNWELYRYFINKNKHTGISIEGMEDELISPDKSDYGDHRSELTNLLNLFYKRDVISKREKDVLYAKAILYLTLEQIAKNDGISKQRIHQIYSRAISKIREHQRRQER